MKVVCFASLYYHTGHHPKGTLHPRGRNSTPCSRRPVQFTMFSASEEKRFLELLETYKENPDAMYKIAEAMGKPKKEVKRFHSAYVARGMQPRKSFSETTELATNSLLHCQMECIQAQVEVQQAQVEVHYAQVEAQRAQLAIINTPVVGQGGVSQEAVTRSTQVDTHGSESRKLHPAVVDLKPLVVVNSPKKRAAKVDSRLITQPYKMRKLFGVADYILQVPSPDQSAMDAYYNAGSPVPEDTGEVNIIEISDEESPEVPKKEGKKNPEKDDPLSPLTKGENGLLACLVCTSTRMKFVTCPRCDQAMCRGCVMKLYDWDFIRKDQHDCPFCKASVSRWQWRLNTALEDVLVNNLKQSNPLLHDAIIELEAQQDTGFKEFKVPASRSPQTSSARSTRRQPLSPIDISSRSNVSVPAPHRPIDQYNHSPLRHSNTQVTLDYIRCPICNCRLLVSEIEFHVDLHLEDVNLVDTIF